MVANAPQRLTIQLAVDIIDKLRPLENENVVASTEHAAAMKRLNAMLWRGFQRPLDP